MLIFWWTGKGYQTALIIFATLVMCVVVLRASDGLIAEGPIFWAITIMIASIANWFWGSRANQIRLAKNHPRTVRDRLFYKARHRFMSLPMETFSAVLMLIGAAVLASGLT